MCDGIYCYHLDGRRILFHREDGLPIYFSAAGKDKVLEELVLVFEKGTCQVSS
jgi:hypothetical protein